MNHPALSSCPQCWPWKQQKSLPSRGIFQCSTQSVAQSAHYLERVLLKGSLKKNLKRIWFVPTMHQWCLWGKQYLRGAGSWVEVLWACCYTVTTWMHYLLSTNYHHHHHHQQHHYFPSPSVCPTTVTATKPSRHSLKSPLIHLAIDYMDGSFFIKAREF